MTLAGGTNAIEKVPGTVGICDNCGLPNVPLHMASTRAVFCTTCAQDMVGVGLYCWVDSLPADREAVIQVLGGSPLNTPIVTEHPLSPYIELPQDPSFVVGPDGNKWEILEEVTTDGLPCPECEAGGEKKGHLVRSSVKGEVWLHVRCDSCYVYLWAPLVEKGTTDDA